MLGCPLDHNILHRILFSILVVRTETFHVEQRGSVNFFQDGSRNVTDYNIFETNLAMGIKDSMEGGDL